MSFKVLAINPGSTSTKVALYEDERPLFELTLRHSAEEIAKFANVAEQLPWRREIVLKALEEQHFDIRELSAVIGRGGLVKPIPAGAYEVNEALREDLIHAQMEHASNLGGLIADEIARMAGVKAYIADPVVVDEMDDVARISGLPQCPRRSIFHALNQKATARKHCEKNGCRYEESNFIVVHLGGGISVSAHCQGRVIDTNNALDGDGPVAPERAGTLPASELVKLCFSGEYTQKEIMKLLAGKGGMVAHLGMNSMMDVAKKAAEGDARCQLMLDALSYNVAKEVGAMATVMKGKVDAIILTGGIAHDKDVTAAIAERCSFIAPVVVYTGENELESLVMNALYVLRGTMEPRVYA